MEQQVSLVQWTMLRVYLNLNNVYVFIIS